MSHLHALAASLDLPARTIGAKAHGLVTMLRLGLPVPPGFVIETAACHEFLRAGRLPPDLDEAVPGSLVSVRSGAAVSMPGMMNTLLNVEASAVPAAVGEVFASWHTPRAITYRELHGIDHALGTAVVVQSMVFGDRDAHSGTGVAFSRDPSTGEKTVFGEVLFARQGDAVVSGESVTQPLSDLATREPAVWEELVVALETVEGHYRDVCHVEFTFEAGRLWFLQVRPGGLVGRAAVRVAVDLVDEGVIERATAVRRISPRDVRLARSPRIRSAQPGADLRSGVDPRSGVDVRSEVDVRSGVDVRSEVDVRSGVDVRSEVDLRSGGDPRSGGGHRSTGGQCPQDVITRGQGASPGVAAGRIAVTADSAVRMAANGPVVLVRPHTSPLDMHGLAAAGGVVTSRGGPASHAAVVARSMGKPAVVSATALVVDEAARCVRVGDRVLPEGEFITIDGAGGEVIAGDPGSTPGSDDPHLQRLLTWMG